VCFYNKKSKKLFQLWTKINNHESHVGKKFLKLKKIKF
jgi:hypothetical protein